MSPTASAPHKVLALAGCSVAWLKVELRAGSEVRFEFSDVTAVVVEAAVGLSSAPGAAAEGGSVVLARSAHFQP